MDPDDAKTDRLFVYLETTIFRGKTRKPETKLKKNRSTNMETKWLNNS